MPTYRSITVSLVSQFDILTVPEFAPRVTESTDSDHQSIRLVDAVSSVVSVYIPTYPASQFWLSYSVSPPYPPGALFYFKLYLNDAHVVSWGVSEKDGYAGKTMFGMFDVGRDDNGRRVVEKRVFCFGREEDGEARGVLELRVFRAQGRKRIEKALESRGQEGTDMDSYGQDGYGGLGVNLIHAGKLERHHPQRFYTYALLDRIDQPFATFRYFYRPWERLEALGVVNSSPSPTPSLAQNASPKNSRCENMDIGPVKTEATEIMGGIPAITLTHSASASISPPPSAIFPPTSSGSLKVDTTATGTGRASPFDWLRRTPSPLKRDPEAVKSSSPPIRKGRISSIRGGLLRGIATQASGRLSSPRMIDR